MSPEQISNPLDIETQNLVPSVSNELKLLPPLSNPGLNPLKEELGDSMVNTQKLVFGTVDNWIPIGKSPNNVKTHSDDSENVLIERPRRNLIRVNYKKLNDGCY